MDNNQIPNQDYKVLVRCFTYNHAQYIEDALNGFVMQKTDFPFVCLVMDDFSTDGEQDVIRAFLDRECDMEKAEYYDTELSEIVIALHRTNQQCTMAVYFLKQNLYGTGKKTPLVTPWREHCKYEALCEGDDYWIDPLKLQKQYDFLESHPDCGMCCTSGRELSSRGFSDRAIIKVSSLLDSKDVIRWGGGYILTASIMFNMNMYLSRPQEIFVGATGDYPLQMYFALKSNIYYLADWTCVYRANIAYDSFSNRMLRRPVAERMVYWRKEMNMLRLFDEYCDYKEHEIFNQARGNFMYHKFVVNPDSAAMIFEKFPGDCACMNTEQMRKALFIKNHLSFYKTLMMLTKCYYALKSNIYNLIYN